MRLLIIGNLAGQIGAASQIAVKKGGSVFQAQDINAAMTLLCSGQGADLIMADVAVESA